MADSLGSLLDKLDWLLLSSNGQQQQQITYVPSPPVHMAVDSIDLAMPELRDDLYQDAKADIQGVVRCGAELDDLFDDVKILPRSSASPSVQFLARIGGVPVFVKMSFSRRRFASGDDPMQIERTIYKTVIPEISDYSPHFTHYLGTIVCPNFMQTFKESSIFQSTAFQEAFQTLVTLKKIRARPDVAYLLITEQALPDGTQLNAILQDHVLEWDEFKKILFQIAHTLLVMEKARFIHNDLHPNNLFVYTMNEEKTMYYEVGEDVYCITTQYFVAFFDWDRSVIEPNRVDITPVSNNSNDVKGFCDSVGQCGKFTPTLDWFKICRHIYNVALRIGADNPWGFLQPFKTWIKSYIAPRLFKRANPPDDEFSFLCVGDPDSSISKFIPNNVEHARRCPAVEWFTDVYDVAKPGGPLPFIKPLSYVLKHGFKEFLCPDDIPEYPPLLAVIPMEIHE